MTAPPVDMRTLEGAQASLRARAEAWRRDPEVQDLTIRGELARRPGFCITRESGDIAVQVSFMVGPRQRYVQVAGYGPTLYDAILAAWDGLGQLRGVDLVGAQGGRRLLRYEHRYQNGQPVSEEAAP